MEKKGSSLSQLREAGAARKIVNAQDMTAQALEEVRRTTEVLRARLDEQRSRGFVPQHYFPMARAARRLPRAVPLWG